MTGPRLCALVALWLALVATRAAAQAPELRVFVTDDDTDVYVGLFDGRAVELAGCSDAGAARRLLALPAEVQAVETTRDALIEAAGLGAQTPLPCPGQPFDLGWPATTPIWADVTGSGRYYLPAPAGGDFYAIEAGCDAMKDALAIRERLQLPGVLQAIGPPPDLAAPIVLGCGEGAAEPDPEAPDLVADPAGWSLHVFDTFLSETSIGDTIFVARYRPADGVPSYLPIWRVDGVETARLTLEGGSRRDQVEAGLRTLFGLAAGTPVDPLGAEAVGGVRSAVHVDLCLTACTGYGHRHAGFLRPEIDLTLTEIGQTVVSAGLDRAGHTQLTWAYLPGREAALTECARLASALGLHATLSTDWMELADAAVSAAPPESRSFRCAPSAGELCLRRVAEGGRITPDMLAPGADCPGAAHLRLELPTTAQTSGPMAIRSGAFESVTFVPASGLERARIVATAGATPAGASACALSGLDVLISAAGVKRLVLERVDLARDAASPGDPWAISIEEGQLALLDSRLGGESAGAAALGRGVIACLAEIYVVGGRIDAAELGLRGIAAHILLSGRSEAPAVVAGDRYGIHLSTDGALRLDRAELAATHPVVLRGGTMRATASSLIAPGGLAAGGAGVRLERGAEAELVTSTVSGFGCAVSLADPTARAEVLLPGNDLALDNTRVACGTGQFSLLE